MYIILYFCTKLPQNESKKQITLQTNHNHHNKKEYEKNPDKTEWHRLDIAQGENNLC